jgi:hypothetical protein
MRTRLSFFLITALTIIFVPSAPNSTAATSNVEIQAITDAKAGSVDLTFNSKIAKASVVTYQITAKPTTLGAASYSKTFTKKVSGYISQRVTPLTPGTNYKFNVIIKTTNKKVFNSTDFKFYTASKKPTGPVITKAIATDADEAIVYFDAPDNDGQTPVLYYTANSYPGYGAGIALQEGSGSITITGLTPSSTYAFTITAHNINGSSLESKPSEPVTTLATKLIRVASTSSNGTNLGAPAFTLSRSAETRTVGISSSGYTITDTGGTIDNYAISPALPAGLTFSTSTGLISGAPTETRTATTHTITATNASGSATATLILTVTTAPTKLILSRISIGTTPGVAFSTQPQITIQDANSETVTASSAVVTATISAGGTLVGTKTATAVSGIATFTNLGIRGYGGTSYTITYSSTGLTPVTQSVTPSAYSVGGTGPGGGKIFYVAGSGGFTCGSTLSEKCYYLEAAPPALGLASSDSDTVHSTARTWAATTYQSQTVPDFGDITAAQAVGYGYRNTILIIAQGNNDPSTSAAALAQSYRGGGQTDWFLPSRQENNQLCYWQTASACNNGGEIQNSGTGATGFVANGSGYAGGYYWSSSEISSTQARVRIFQQGGDQGADNKSKLYFVRPIRAF